MAIAVIEHRLRVYTSFIKLEHTVFSLPLIVTGTLLNARGWPSGRMLALILLAAVGGRVMAMGLNRIIDAQIDARNPRTRGRELPRGVMERWEAWLIVVLAGLLYVGSAAELAPICLWLSPIPVALFVLYPYLKRFTVFSHLAGIDGGLAEAGALQALPGVDAAAAERHMALRAARDDCTNREPLPPISGAETFLIQSHGLAYTVTAEAAMASGAVFRRQAVVWLNLRPDRPYLILSWTEPRAREPAPPT